ncbi:DICT sensory domain-containing protein [cf. Phormidesmis sp. LEGE 11477]|uniref:DICT sensory domain-containing protein n=1 Tax=cf. Phormidesmis sp. LEGE 11477 TaxID=1828680 RepID=UPI001D1455B0|nr:DICT sensory domain-containing protein [cf. Phormidesmis sp. LEGE 11477]
MQERRSTDGSDRGIPAKTGENLSQESGPQEPQTSGRTPLNFGVYYKNTLVALCHALEDAVLATKTSPLMVTAFQKGKWYLQEADRYADLADTADKIVILAAPGAGFREHPTGDRDNVELVDLSVDDPVSEEWHLMIMSSRYSAMVLCQELTEDEYGPEGKPENDLERKFYGFWTFDPALVKETIAITADHVGRYSTQLKADLEERLADIDTQAASKTGEVGNVVMRVVDYLKGGDRQVEATETFKFAGALSQNLVSNELQAYLRMAQLADLADITNPLAAAEVASLCEMMGQFLDLPVWQMQRLRLASLLHRIAPAQLESGAMDSEGDSCPLNPGAQTLRVLPRLRAIAQIIAHQHEWWNGTGQPAGLAGDNIPVEARTLGLVAAFQHAVAHRRHKDEQRASPSAKNEWQYVADAFADCKAQSGERWDPKLVEILSFLVSGLQQGLSLPSIPLKMTLSTGIIDSDVVDSWPTYQPLETPTSK